MSRRRPCPCSCPGSSLRSRRQRPQESGSAYVIALLVLLILTLIGLALAVITTTEMRIGANEQIIQQTFFAADAGLGVNLARTFHSSDTKFMTLELPDPPGGGSHPLLRSEVFLVNSYVLGDMACNLCEVTETNGKEYQRLNLLSTSIGRRVQRSDGQVAAETTVSTVYDMMVIEKGNLDIGYYNLEEALMQVRDEYAIQGRL